MCATSYAAKDKLAKMVLDNAILITLLLNLPLTRITSTVDANSLTWKDSGSRDLIGGANIIMTARIQFPAIHVDDKLG